MCINKQFRYVFLLRFNLVMHAWGADEAELDGTYEIFD